MATNTVTSGGGGAGVIHGGSSGSCSSSSHYDVLGISRTATSDEIKKAYRKLSLRWHPDKNPANCIEARRRFNDISTAYQVLSNTRQRSLYDRRLMTSGSGLNGDCTDGRPTVNGDISAAATGDEDFILRDPRAVFHDFFGGRDPFSEGFGIPVTDELTTGLMSTAGGGDCSLTNCVSPPIFRRISVSSDCSESMPKSCCGSSFATNTNTTTVKSVATSTRFVHGKKIVTKKVVENGQETVTIEEDGELMSKTVNGVAVAVSLPSQEAACSNDKSTVSEPPQSIVPAAAGTDLSNSSAASSRFVNSATPITDPLLNNCVETR